jgi:hypothetical protein
MSCMMRLMMVPDMASSVWPQTRMARQSYCLVLALFRSQVNQPFRVFSNTIARFRNRGFRLVANDRHSTRKINSAF